MNGKQRSTTSSTGSNFNSYNFDFGIPSSRSSTSSRPLRNASASTPAPTPSFAPTPSTQSTTRPAWTHQPAANKPTGLNPTLQPTSMVGDIFGKSWSSSTPSGTSSLGIPQNKNPNLFGDLFASALGSGRGSQSNVPLKSAAPAASKTTFSMNNLSDSLPKSTESGSNFPSFTSQTAQPTRSATGSIGSKPMMGQPQKKDPFESLSDFGSTQKPTPISTPVSEAPIKTDNFGFSTNFDDFQMPSAQTFSSSSSTTTSKPSPLPTDNMDMFFSSTTTTAPPPPSNEMNDWDIASDFASADTGGTTTELEGLPPPPSGLSGQAAKSKGMDNYKGGQYADAIKWLSWAFVILDKSGDQDAITEVLSCRASSYKEVGEYKKAIADCTKILENDEENVSVLVQRALLYESNEKYRLGAEDLRMVLKIDPGNRLARSTIHRLQKMAD